MEIVKSDQLPTAAKQKAEKAIENAHLAYYEKGGVRDLEDELDQKRESAGQHIYRLAVYAAGQEKQRERQIGLFLGLCAYAEQWYKEQHSVENLREALPTWAVYKSNILRGVRQIGLDPRDYRSERTFRNAMLEHLPPPSTDRKRSSTTQSHESDLDAVLGEVIEHDSLRKVLAEVIGELEALKPGKVKAALRVLKGAAAKIAPLTGAH